MTVNVIDKTTGEHKHIFDDVVIFDCHYPNEYVLWFSNGDPYLCGFTRREIIQVDFSKEWISVSR